ncbi:MAG: hypothetical protein SF069_08715 [Phycisphaerae bacterium]|nr:hypothetical protein [Phycisphaerae bacterium]
MCLLSLLLPFFLSAFQASNGAPCAEYGSPEKVLEAHAGLFVGVERLGPRETASVPVDDAVALAHLFVLEMGTLPAKRTTIALSGPPTAERAAQLRALEQAGVERISATRESVRSAVRRVASLPSAPYHVLIVSLSSAGFVTDEMPYIAATDTNRAAPANSALDLLEIANLLATSQAADPLLFVDAVPDNLPGGSREAAEQRDARFVGALAKTSGVDLIAAITSEHTPQPSAHPGLSHFTGLLIDVLRGAAKRSKSGLVMLNELICDIEPRLRGDAAIGIPAAPSPHYVRASDIARTPVAITSADAEALLFSLRTATICSFGSLLLEVTDDNDPAPLGATVTYTIRVTSQQTCRILHDIEIHGELPPGLSFQSSTGPTGPAMVDGRRFAYYPVADLPPRGALEFRFVAKCDQTGDSTTRIQMWFREFDRGPIEETERTRVW